MSSLSSVQNFNKQLVRVKPLGLGAWEDGTVAARWDMSRDEFRVEELERGSVRAGESWKISWRRGHCAG